MSSLGAVHAGGLANPATGGRRGRVKKSPAAAAMASEEDDHHFSAAGFGEAMVFLFIFLGVSAESSPHFSISPHPSQPHSHAAGQRPNHADIHFAPTVA